jgi:hypothetical protein
LGLSKKELFAKYNLGYQIRKKKKVWACRMYGRGEVHTGFWWRYLRNRTLGRPRCR